MTLVSLVCIFLKKIEKSLRNNKKTKKPQKSPKRNCINSHILSEIRQISVEGNRKNHKKKIVSGTLQLKNSNGNEFQSWFGVGLGWFVCLFICFLRMFNFYKEQPQEMVKYLWFSVFKMYEMFS